MTDPSRRSRSLRANAASALLLVVALSAGAFGMDHTAHLQMAGSAAGPAAVDPASMGPVERFIGFWDNYGHYMPRYMCLQNAQGKPDWPWIVAISLLCTGVVVGYYRIYVFWRRNYLAEQPRDRNAKLMDIAQIFLWCAVCGYGMSIVMFVWPAYRLLAVFLVILNIFTYRFAANLSALTVSLSAVRLKRELEESLANRAAELERLVELRTRELEEARAAAIAATEAKTEFLANMSHEIRTPMTAILGFTDLLDNPKLDPAMRSRHLRTVRESGRHLLAVVNDILDLARIEAGKLRVERVACDVHAILQDAVALLTPRATERKLTLALNVEPGTPRTIATDPTRLRQIVINLLGNAIKFTEAGSVTLDARPDPSDPSRIAVAVIDTGIGMDEEQLARLFERFNQFGTPGHHNKYGGSGLGLVISKQLTTLLGGELRVDSQPGRGSRFTVLLPAFQAAIESPASRLTAPSNGQAASFNPVTEPVASPEPVANGAHANGMSPQVGPAAPSIVTTSPAVSPPTFPPDAKILLVDDGDENRQLVRFLLEQHGLTVETAENGQIALDRIAAAPDGFDLVLMDIQMPHVDGYVATSTLRTRQFTRPIVALTASTMTGDREKCLAAGCDEYISKPIHTDSLLRTVERLLAAK